MTIFGTRAAVGSMAPEVVGLDGTLVDAAPPATVVDDGTLDKTIELKGRLEDD